MKKDIFNGYIKKEFIGFVKFSLILASSIFLACSLIFLFVVLFYENVDSDAKIFLFVSSIIGFICTFLYSIGAIYIIRNYPKYKKIANLLLQPYVFNNNYKNDNNAK